MTLTLEIFVESMYLYKFEGHCNDVNKDQVKLELVFLKHYAPNSFP